MREYGLIGYPLTHSFSQKYFTEKFQRDGIANAVFLLFAIPSIDYLPHLLEEHTNSLEGFCITIPYKRSVIPYLTSVSEAVTKMNACNCVKIEGHKLYGYNTDVTGFELSFIRKLKPHHTHALILGTGGASSAVAYVLDKLHIKYKYVSRYADKDRGIIGYGDIDAQVLQQNTVVINCTPLGMYPETSTAPDFPYHLLNDTHYLFDLVYNPPLTKFLQLGMQQGAATENGYDMLVLQAEENWKIWNS